MVKTEFEIDKDGLRMKVDYFDGAWRFYKYNKFVEKFQMDDEYESQNKEEAIKHCIAEHKRLLEISSYDFKRKR